MVLQVVHTLTFLSKREWNAGDKGKGIEDMVSLEEWIALHHTFIPVVLRRIFQTINHVETTK